MYPQDIRWVFLFEEDSKSLKDMLCILFALEVSRCLLDSRSGHLIPPSSSDRLSMVNKMTHHPHYNFQLHKSKARVTL